MSAISARNAAGVGYICRSTRDSSVARSIGSFTASQYSGSSSGDGGSRNICHRLSHSSRVAISRSAMRSARSTAWSSSYRARISSSSCSRLAFSRTARASCARGNGCGASPLGAFRLGGGAGATAMLANSSKNAARSGWPGGLSSWKLGPVLPKSCRISGSSSSMAASADPSRNSGRSGGRSASSIHSVARSDKGAVSHHSCRCGRKRIAGAARRASTTACTSASSGVRADTSDRRLGRPMECTGRPSRA
mmetsp:Transcript_18485/g.48280  ORF Transcript_18485/g.48280 Transcript_18485/m.48280 type:complete len:250 (-) Transcript_18485:519-1268(-)